MLWITTAAQITITLSPSTQKWVRPYHLKKKKYICTLRNSISPSTAISSHRLLSLLPLKFLKHCVLFWSLYSLESSQPSASISTTSFKLTHQGDQQTPCSESQLNFTQTKLAFIVHHILLFPWVPKNIAFSDFFFSLISLPLQTFFPDSPQIGPSSGLSWLSPLISPRAILSPLMASFNT